MTMIVKVIDFQAMHNKLGLASNVIIESYVDTGANDIQFNCRVEGAGFKHPSMKFIVHKTEVVYTEAWPISLSEGTRYFTGLVVIVDGLMNIHSSTACVVVSSSISRGRLNDYDARKRADTLLRLYLRGINEALSYDDLPDDVNFFWDSEAASAGNSAGEIELPTDLFDDDMSKPLELHMAEKGYQPLEMLVEDEVHTFWYYIDDVFVTLADVAGEQLVRCEYVSKTTSATTLISMWEVKNLQARRVNEELSDKKYVGTSIEEALRALVYAESWSTYI